MNDSGTSHGGPLFRIRYRSRKEEIGLTRESWRLEVISDPDHPVKLRNPLAKSSGNAIDFASADGTRGKTCRSLSENHDLPQYGLPTWHGNLGRCAAARA